MRRGVHVVLWVLGGLVLLWLGWLYLKKAVSMASEKELVEVEVPVPVVVGVHMMKEQGSEPAAQPVAV